MNNIPLFQILLQDLIVDGDTTIQTVADGTDPSNPFELLMKGGVIIIPIALLFVAAIYLTFERYFTIRKAGRLDDNFMSTIKDMVLNDNIIAAKKLCEKTNSPIARMLEKGISRIGKPLKNIEVAVENVGKLEIYKLEKGMPILATIAGAAPMLGFLGTVTGMITTFRSISNMGDTVTPSALSGGIYEAMVTTVAGLVVGIVAFLAYNLLTAMIEKVVHNMEARSVEFLDLLQQPSE